MDYNEIIKPGRYRHFKGGEYEVLHIARHEGEWALNIKSVVIFGRMHIVEDNEKKKEVCTNIVRKFTDDEEYLQKELVNAFPRVCCLELIPEHMTGKLVNES